MKNVMWLFIYAVTAFLLSIAVGDIALGVEVDPDVLSEANRINKLFDETFTCDHPTTQNMTKEPINTNEFSIYLAVCRIICIKKDRSTPCVDIIRKVEPYAVGSQFACGCAPSVRRVSNE